MNKKIYTVSMFHNGQFKGQYRETEWLAAEATLIVLHEDVKGDGFVRITEKLGDQLTEVLRVNIGERLPVNEASEFHLWLRDRYKKVQADVEELQMNSYELSEYTVLQDKFEEAEQILRKFEEMVPHGLKRI